MFHVKQSGLEIILWKYYFVETLLWKYFIEIFLETFEFNNHIERF